MIESIDSPRDLKGMSLKELRALCGEIREKITKTVSENGGHLASNLGIVETTVAIHRVFDTPRDAVLFDVGHQCYAHKMLTGRYGDFATLRKTGGISGFMNADESEYDAFTEGHSGTSLSQALGLSSAYRLEGDDRYVVAVIGDGSFTNGMIYEALNNSKTLGRHLIIILNDNEMSISKNVGGVPSHLTRIRTSRKYFNFKHYLKKFLSKIPLLGKSLIKGARALRDLIKKIFLSYNIFEALGVDYIGVADGNDLGKMINVLEEAKTKDVCTVVHIHTKKGKGYAPAERDPEAFHSVSPFDIETGKPLRSCGETFSSVFGDALCALAAEDGAICAVTAAMEDGTGLSCFKEKFPKRFFDVGIAEEHLVTFSAGLSRGGMKPVAALYSTFAQRTFDQVFQDLSLQHLSATVCLDRAGLVEGDGVTHQGIYDVAEFSPIPGIAIYSPDSFGELRRLLRESVSRSGVDIIRYPKGAEASYDRGAFIEKDGYSVAQAQGAAIALVTYGRVSAVSYEAAVSREYPVKVIRLSRVTPLPDLSEELAGIGAVLFVEEGIRTGGVGERFAAGCTGKNICVFVHAIDGVASHGSLCDLLKKYGFTTEYIGRELDEIKEKI